MTIAELLVAVRSTRVAARADRPLESGRLGKEEGQSCMGSVWVPLHSQALNSNYVLFALGLGVGVFYRLPGDSCRTIDARFLRGLIASPGTWRPRGAGGVACHVPGMGGGSGTTAAEVVHPGCLPVSAAIPLPTLLTLLRRLLSVCRFLCGGLGDSLARRLRPACRRASFPRCTACGYMDGWVDGWMGGWVEDSSPHL